MSKIRVVTSGHPQDSACVRRGDEVGVAPQPRAGHPLLPCRQFADSVFYLSLRELCVNRPVDQVNVDDVAISQGGDGPTRRSLRRDVANRSPAAGAGEAAIGDEGFLLPPERQLPVSEASHIS